MDLFSNQTNPCQVFTELYKASTEEDVDAVLNRYPNLFNVPNNWQPLGNNESNFGVIENQQSSPIAALIEKITNSIDAILMRKCLELGVDPKSPEAPQSMEEAVERFFPKFKDWDLTSFRKQQAENIQILADGPRMNTSLIIYDDGEGQKPEDFEGTFLSLLRGNKNEIKFVQGKYNMGGTGAIVFCGTKRYQLIGSRKYDKSGTFGFTLIRKHPLTKQEEQQKKNTWYEYFKIDGKIPSFPMDQPLDLGLHNRNFETGTIIKLYSYDLPSGSRSVISRDLNQSINEFLFEPALPMYTIDKEERYPDDRNLQRDLYGLKRRLEEDNNKYVEDYFSEVYQVSGIGRMKATCYVFKSRIEDKDVKTSRESIQREFFKNDMAVLFSLNGQVHAHYTFEFITRALKFSLLKDHLLIHVDCTGMNLDFRNELFMASRDRLKSGKEAKLLREQLSKHLRNSKLKEIYKKRKQGITIEGGDAAELLKSLSKNLPLNAELMSLLNQTFKLETQPKDVKKTKQVSGEKSEKDREPFVGKRFPSYLKLKKDAKDGKPAAQIPIGGERTIKFATDVENTYFDRVDDPGEFELAILDFQQNETKGGDKPGQPKEISDVFNVIRSSPTDGTINVVFNPTENVKVGDTVQVKASLSGAGEEFEAIFTVKIADPEGKPAPKPKKVEVEDNRIGLPQHVLVYRDEKEGALTWEKLSESNIEMDYETVMHPYLNDEDGTLETIYINMDSNVLKTYKSKLKSAEQHELADKRYISTVYFHTLFLYSINKNRKYQIIREDNGNEKEVDLTDYLKDIFQSYYSAFLLNFEIGDLMEGLN